MAITLDSIRRVKADQPARILIYGPPGKGKTTLASEFPDVVFVQIEDGTPGEGKELASFGLLKTYPQVMQALNSLLKGVHPYKYVAIDSVTAMQRLVYDETCYRGDDHGKSKKRIEDFGFGKGYNNATQIWQEYMDMINRLRARGIGTIQIGHSSISRFDDPEDVSYDRYDLSLRTSDKTDSDHRGVIIRDMDAVLLLKEAVSIKNEERGPTAKRAIGTGGGTIWIHARSKPALNAKNRYGIPEKGIFKEGQGYEYLSKYLPAAPGVPQIESAGGRAAEEVSEDEADYHDEHAEDEDAAA